MSVGGCAQGLWMNCANTPGWRCDARGHAWRPWRPRPSYQPRCRELDGLREDPEGIEPMPAPDSYPHVTCGRAVRGQPPQGVAAVVATAPKGGNFRDDGDLLVPGHESPLDCARRRSLAAIRPGSRWLHGGAAPRLAGERSNGAAGLVAGVAASLLLPTAAEPLLRTSPGRSALTLIMARPASPGRPGTLDAIVAGPSAG